MSSVTVSIVNTNNRELLRGSLASLTVAARQVHVDVCVVENASTDGSAEMLRAEFPGVSVLQNTRRLGFAANHNQVLRGLAQPYALVLNEDVVLHPGAVDQMVALAEMQPRAGAVGPRILNPDGTLQHSSNRFPSLWLELRKLAPASGARRPVEAYTDVDHEQTQPVEWLGGPCLLLRREALQEIGLFDERFFIFYEEVDLCRRLAAAGWENWFCSSASMVHFGHQAVSQPGLSGVMDRQMYKSKYRYFLKYHGLPAYVLLRAAVVLTLSARIARHLPSALSLRGPANQRAARRQRVRHLLLAAAAGPQTHLQ